MKSLTAAAAVINQWGLAQQNGAIASVLLPLAAVLQGNFAYHYHTQARMNN